MSEKIAQALACCVIGVAYLIILNAYVFIPPLRAQLTPGLGVEFSDGIAFFFTGIISYVVASGQRPSNLVADLMLPASVLILFLLMATRVTSVLMGLHIDVTNMLAGSDAALLEEQSQALPWAEILSFCLVALAGLNLMIRSAVTKRAPLLLGGLLLLLNGAALAGYFLDISWLTGSADAVSLPTSPLAAGLLAVSGIVFLLGSVPHRTVPAASQS